MGRETLSREAFTSFAEKSVPRSGPKTARAEQEFRDTRKLNPLVDPAGYGVTRRSITRMDKVGDHFVAPMGLAMLVENRFDTTTSMGDSLDRALAALPRQYGYLAEGDHAVLGRYDTQIINSTFGDVCDDVVYCRTQAEMGIKIAEQITLLVPVRGGGDVPEDPDYGIFAAAYLTASHARKFGLKSYDFTVTDAPGRGRLDPRFVERIFGDEVYERLTENGFQISRQELPPTTEIVESLLSSAHAFVLQVSGHSDAASFWKGLYGRERVVQLPSVDLLPEIQAVIIGLTEGTLNLQSLKPFLKETAQMGANDADRIVRCVAGIPLGAQTMQPNFKKVFPKGAAFARKGDVFPIDWEDKARPAKDDKPGKPGAKPGKPDSGKPDMWL